MAIEAVRGCGYRKVNGLYLMGEGIQMACDRLPFELVVCPTCGNGVKFSRGFSWLNWYEYAGEHKDCTEGFPPICPICFPAIYTPLLAEDEKVYGLLWCGDSFYTPESFIEEALRLGISRRIPAVPKKFKLGETWVLFAHIKACGTREELQDDETTKTVGVPGVFYATRPTRFEKLVWESDMSDELVKTLEKQGITPVPIPDGDPDHDPEVATKVSKEDRAQSESLSKIAALRRNLNSSRGQ